MIFIFGINTPWLTLSCFSSCNCFPFNQSPRTQGASDDTKVSSGEIFLRDLGKVTAIVLFLENSMRYTRCNVLRAARVHFVCGSNEIFYSVILAGKLRVVRNLSQCGRLCSCVLSHATEVDGGISYLTMRGEKSFQSSRGKLGSIPPITPNY